MLIDIHDVGHGACAVITAPNGKRMMIDCGHSADPVWRPSLAYGGLPVEELVVSNYDEDHVSDLPNLMTQVPLRFMTVNTSVTADDLAFLKSEFGAGPGIARLQRWMREVAGQRGSGSPDYESMKVRHYWNDYPLFDDENNLSIATIIEWAGFKMIFTGDLESEGWKALLRRQDFRADLAGMTALAASHHGRWTGCCPEVFNFCRPQIVVMSDRDIVYESQETTGWYQSRATGAKDTSGETRYVLTTRCDGHIQFRVSLEGRWTVNPHTEERRAG